MLELPRHRAFNIGAQRLLQGDCLQIMAHLESGSVDVVVTSPPYNLKVAYRTYHDNRSSYDYIEWLYCVFTEVKRLLRADGSLFINVSGSSSQPWLPFELAGRLRTLFELQNHIMWIKAITTSSTSSGHFKPISGSRFTHHNHEHIFHFTRTGKVELDRLAIGVPFTDKTNISRRGHARDLRCRGNTWFIPYKTVQSRAGKFLHPSTFPVELPLWCIFLHGRENAVVLDPFVGTGTTLVAARLARSSGIGIELDRAYVAVSERRIAEVERAAMDIQLNESEMQSLLEQDPKTKGDGGFQSLLVRLQGKLNRSTGHLTLTDDDVADIHRYAAYTQGGWQTRLALIFGRTLGIGKAA